MSSNAEDAAQLTPEQRWEVLCLYRRFRLGMGGPRGTHPIDALTGTHRVLAAWCTHAVLDGNPELALVRARQCSYELALVARMLGHGRSSQRRIPKVVIR